MADLLERLRTALADRYTIERELGAGGMATVYLAEDLKHERHVAIKVLRPELASALGPERFLREIKTTAQLNHPHILPLHDSGEADGFLFYVMPFVEGESLRQRLDREKQLPIEHAVAIACDVASALGYAHAHGVVHRDIKPDNVLLSGGKAVVADFGIARAIGEAGGDKLTQTGIAVGTPAYMSPEQAGGGKDLDACSDIYSLGCVVYETLAGHPPFTGVSAQEVLARHSLDVVPSLSAARPTVPPAIEAAITKALAKVPADRFASAERFADALTTSESSSVAQSFSTSVSPATPWGRAAMLGGAAVLVVAGALAVVRASRSDEPQRSGTVVTPPRTAIAVLPFDNLSTDGPHAYFASALHGELLIQLAKVGGIKPISRTSVMSYSGPDLPPLPQIAGELGVGSIVEASVQVLSGRLRVNVQLVDAGTGAPLWSEQYDENLGDAFAIQSDIAQRIVDAVGAALIESERQSLAAAPTSSPEAYQLYLQGQDYGRRPGYLRENWEAEEQLYEAALALDSTFALAHAALSWVHGNMYWFRYDTSPRRLAAQREAAEQALRLAPPLPQAHIAMGLVHYYGHRDYQRALHQFTVALEGLPRDASLLALVGYVHRRLGNWSQVVGAYERAAMLDPRNAALHLELGCVSLLHMRLYPEAMRACEQALKLAPDFHHAAIVKASIQIISEGRLDSLRAAIHRIPLGAEVGSFGTRLAEHARLLLLERQPDSLLNVVAPAHRAVFDGQILFIPAALYVGWAHRLRGDSLAAQVAFYSAMERLDSAMVGSRDDWRVHAARGLALAALGRSREALREADWLKASAIYRNDAFWGVAFLALYRAQILVQAAERNAALEEIEHLLAGPSWTSVHTLGLDPLFDPIRDDPRFQALLVKYDPPQPVPIGRGQ